MEPSKDPDVGRAQIGNDEPWTRWVLALGLVVHLACNVSLITNWLDPLFVEARDSYGQAADYFGIYQGGDNLLHGVSVYDSQDYGNVAERRVPYFYFYRWLPPTAYFMALQAAFLPPWTAYVVWVVVNEILYLLFAFALLRHPGAAPGTRRLFAGVVLGFTPFYLEQWMGQFSFVMTLLIWGTLAREFARYHAGRPLEASGHGFWGEGSFWSWCGAITIKNFPALLGIPFLLQRRWRRVAAAAGIVLALSIPYYVARPEDLAHFIHLNLKPVPPTLSRARYGMIQMLHAFARKITAALGDPVFHLGLRDVHLSAAVLYAWYLGVFAATAWITWKRPRRPEVLVLWILAFFLVFKDVWEYHHVMLLPCLFLLAVHGPRRVPLLVAILLALPTPYVLYASTWEAVDPVAWPYGLLLIHFGAKAIPVFLLYLWTARRALTATRETPRIAK